MDSYLKIQLFLQLMPPYSSAKNHHVDSNGKDQE